jgi:NMD protein affecting ribosome stability and mRNA decay
MSLRSGREFRYYLKRDQVLAERDAGNLVCYRCGIDLNLPDPHIRRQTSLCQTCWDDQDGLRKQKIRDGQCVRCGGPNKEPKHKTCSSCREKAREYQRARRRKACQV